MKKKPAKSTVVPFRVKTPLKRAKLKRLPGVSGNYAQIAMLTKKQIKACGFDGNVPIKTEAFK